MGEVKAETAGVNGAGVPPMTEILGGVDEVSRDLVEGLVAEFMRQGHMTQEFMLRAVAKRAVDAGVRLGLHTADQMDSEQRRRSNGNGHKD